MLSEAKAEWMRQEQSKKLVHGNRHTAGNELKLRAEAERTAEEKEYKRRAHQARWAHIRYFKVREQQRAVEADLRKSDIAFRFPIYWYCWREQCKLAQMAK